jgi:hypothetical protein
VFKNVDGTEIMGEWTHGQRVKWINENEENLI